MLFFIICNVNMLKVKDFAECFISDFGVLSPKCVYTLNTHQTTEGSGAPCSSFTKTKSHCSQPRRFISFLETGRKSLSVNECSFTVILISALQKNS